MHRSERNCFRIFGAVLVIGVVLFVVGRVGKHPGLTAVGLALTIVATYILLVLGDNQLYRRRRLKRADHAASRYHDLLRLEPDSKPSSHDLKKEPS